MKALKLMEIMMSNNLLKQLNWSDHKGLWVVLLAELVFLVVKNINLVKLGDNNQKK